jgi:hypothetical protein
MKKTLILIALTVFLLNAYAQKNKESKKGEKQVSVPGLVEKTFTAKYPKATKVEWGLEKQGEYEAEFKLNKDEMSVVLDEKGNLIEIETEIKKSEVPQSIISTLTKDFADYKIDEVEKLESQGVISYEMEAKKGKDKFEQVFDNTGKIVKKEQKKVDEEDKD